MASQLPVDFYTQKDRYLKALSKKVTKAKERGETDENEADPIPLGLYAHINKWAVDEGNCFVWSWTTLQWNIIGRCANVETLAFHNIKVFTPF